MRTPGTKVTFGLAVLVAGALFYAQAIGAVLEDGGPAFAAETAPEDAAGTSVRSGPSDSNRSAGTRTDAPGPAGGAGRTQTPAADGSASTGTGATPDGNDETPPPPPPSPDDGFDAPPPGEPLVVVTPTILAIRTLSGGAPSLFQVGASIVVARFADVLPPEAVGPILDGYQQGVDAVTAGQTAAAELLTSVSDSTLSFGPLLNPILRPLGVALITAVATSLEDNAGLLAENGFDVSFASYAADALRSTAVAFGLG